MMNAWNDGRGNMNEGMREDVILWEVEPEGAGPFSGGSLTVWPHQVGIVMQDGRVVDIFSEGKKKLPRKGEVRTYVASTSPFDLKFDLKDPFGADHRGAELDQFVLTRDREVVTGSVDLRLRVVRENVEHLFKLLGPGSGGVTQLDVSDVIKTELQAKVLALDIHKYTSEELRGNRELFAGMYESVKIEMSSSIRFFGLRLDNFYPNWGLTHEEREGIKEQLHQSIVRDMEREEELGGWASGEVDPLWEPAGAAGIVAGSTRHMAVDPPDAPYYTPRSGYPEDPQFLGYEAGSPSGMDEVSDSSQDLSGTGIAMIAAGVLIASALLVAAFFLAPQIFAGIFVLGLVIVMGGAYMGTDTIRNVGIVVLIAGVVGMVGAAVFRTG